MFELRDYQREAVTSALRYFASDWDGGSLMVLPTGCHNKGTGIVMADASIRDVESVCVGDYVMGPDGQPRRVLSLCRGVGTMYRIIPRRGGKPFIVNGEHILSLLSTSEGKKAVCPSHQRGGEQQFITVSEYLTKSKSWKNLRKLHRAGELGFDSQNKLTVPPWILGVILGDGCMLNGVVNVTTPDPEIISGVRQFANDASLELRISEKGDNKAITLHIVKKDHRHNRTFRNPLYVALEAMYLTGKGSEDKFVPEVYKTSSVSARLEMLAGLLDTDGFHDGQGGYDFISKSERLSSDLTFIARSLGITANGSLAYKEAQTGVGGYYHRVYLSGDTHKIPCRVQRKQAPPRLQKKNSLVTGFSIEPIGDGDYYGFTLNGDHLYLTSDFFVHHNSGKSLVIASIAARLDEPTIVFQPTKEILEQNLGKLHSYGVDAAVYSASMNSKNIGNLTYATIGSVRNHMEFFKQFRNIIIDECHYVNAKGGMYQDFLSFIEANKVLGLTATPYRLVTDGYGGSILKFISRTRPRVFVRVIHVTQNADLFRRGYLAQLEYKQVGMFDSSRLRLNSTGADYDDRSVRRYYDDISFSDDLVEAVQQCIDAGRKSILVFTRFVEESESLVKALGGDAAIVTADTSKKERERIISQFRNGQIRVVSNVGILNVGFDFPELETIVIARPTMSLALYYQMIGRGVRPHPNKQSAWVLDLCDNFSKFGRVEDLYLIKSKPGMWFIESKGRQLTNVYYGERRI
jgi:superfamily II DNA or RNA helicase